MYVVSCAFTSVTRERHRRTFWVFCTMVVKPIDDRQMRGNARSKRWLEDWAGELLKLIAWSHVPHPMGTSILFHG